MHIAYYAPSAGRNFLGGAETFVRETSYRLSEKHIVDIITGDNRVIDEKKVSGKIFSFKYASRESIFGKIFTSLTFKKMDAFWIESLTFFLSTAKFMKKYKADVIIFIYLPDLLAGRFFNGKKILSFQGYPLGFRKKIHKGIIDICKPDYSFSCSNYVRKAVEYLNIPGETLYNGVDTGRFSPGRKSGQLMDRYGIDEDDFVILFVGRLSRQKGIEVLIKSLRYIKIDSFKALIVGGGPLKKEIKNLVMKENLTDKVIFAGSVPHDKLPAIYRLADVFVSPSIFEPLSIVTIEAISTGIPVIVSDTGGLKEICDSSCGFTFKVGDHLDLSRKIDILYKDTELRKIFSENGRKRALDIFSWDKIVSQLENILKKTANL